MNTVCKEHEWVREDNLNRNGRKRIWMGDKPSYHRDYYLKHKNDKYAREYRIWMGIKNRCLNKDCQIYSYYGGRGIKICERWLVFENFINDVGEATSEKHSADRFPDNNGNYEPTNFRWASREEQVRNKRRNIFIEYQGRTHILSEWERILKLPRSTLRNWYTIRGYSLEEIIKRYNCVLP